MEFYFRHFRVFLYKDFLRCYLYKDDKFIHLFLCMLYSSSCNNTDLEIWSNVAPGVTAAILNDI